MQFHFLCYCAKCKQTNSVMKLSTYSNDTKYKTVGINS